MTIPDDEAVILMAAILNAHRFWRGDDGMRDWAPYAQGLCAGVLYQNMSSKLYDAAVRLANRKEWKIDSTSNPYAQPHSTKN